jgi:NAD+ synthase/NAD+ synthase (glutamine-hydrolysing)
MRLALGQINPTVGDLDGNARLILDASRRAAASGAHLVLFPELSLNGYPPRDLVEVPSFLRRTRERLERLACETADLGADVLVGFVGQAREAGEHRASNSAALLSGGRVVFEQQKMLLPTYDVFDEWRYFAPAHEQHVCEIRGVRVGVTICEDVWNDKEFWERPRYRRDPITELSGLGIDLLVNIASSPYHMTKRGFREEMLRSAVARLGVPAVMVNQVGGNDQLLFDGSSFALDARGRIVARALSFEPDLVYFDTETGEGDLREPPKDELEAVYDALVMGVRDYVHKCGFRQVVLGLSGGIDSSLTAVIAVDALGAENVTGLGMPGPYSSEGSVSDARAMAEALGVRFEIVSIRSTYDAFVETLAPLFAGSTPDVTEENLQARLRGATVMAFSNKFGALPLTTGNKSEIAVGYCTLYGDMVGGLAVISDIPKTLVYELSRVANRRHPGGIPDAVFTKPPSAELRPDQKDTDSLPPYEVLDPILRLYVEERVEPAEIASRLGVELDLVRRICRMVDRNEYKRQQAAPGLRVTTKAFGVGRRFPIAQRFEP